MQPQETFTTDEILKILDDIGVSAEKDESNLDDLGGAYEDFECEFGPIQFRCCLGADGPFHSVMRLFAYNYTSDNPYEVVNKFNRDSFQARAVVHLNDDGTLEQDDDGDFGTIARLVVPFQGTVSPEHVKFLLNMWIEDLVTYFEIEFEEEETDDDESDDVPATAIPTKATGTLVDRIALVLGKTSNRTARQLTRELSASKNDINSALYGSKELFKNDGAQPPKWSLR